MADLSELNVNNTDYNLKDAAARNDIRSTQVVSGNPLTLTDCAPINAESLVVELEPKQDLHGQSAPYVGGAGKNKADIADMNVQSQTTMGRLTLPSGTYVASATVKNNTSIGGSIKINTSSGTLTVGAIPSASGTSRVSTESFTLSESTEIVVVVSGAVSGYNYDVSQVQIELGTTATSFAPWENICLITGYTECEVDDVGVNQWDEEWELGDLDVNGQPVAASNLIRTKNYIDVFPNTTYYFKSNVIGYFAQYDANKIIIGIKFNVYAETTFTTASNARYVKFILDGTYGTTYNHDISINYPSTDTNYHPYQSRTASISFGQTVYGGKSNFTDGGTSETMGETVLDGTTAPSNSFERTNTVAGFVPIGNQKKYATTHQTKVMCDSMPVFSPDYVYVNDVFGVSENISASANGIWVSVYKDMLTSYDITGLQAWLVANNLQIAYELETNVNISTPSTDLKLLKGTNNLSTNGTTINLGYQPDNVIGEVKGEIQKITEMPYLRILDNDIDTEVKNYRLYYRLISSSYTLVNLAEMLQHRFLFVEIIQNPSGTANHTLLHSALIDPRTIDGFEYQMKAGTGDTVIIESNIAENKFELSVRYTGTHTSGDPTDYYVTIRLVD